MSSLYPESFRERDDPVLTRSTPGMMQQAKAGIMFRRRRYLHQPTWMPRATRMLLLLLLPLPLHTFLSPGCSIFWSSLPNYGPYTRPSLGLTVKAVLTRGRDGKRLVVDLIIGPLSAWLCLI